MIAPISQIVWFHRRLFFAAMSLSLMIAAVVIFFLVRPHVMIQSLLQIGSSAVNDGQEPITAPELVVKTVSAVYVPSALLLLEGKGVSPSTLSSLRTLNVESIGRMLVLTNTVEPSTESRTIEFQKLVADEISRGESNRTQIARERLTEQLAFLTDSYHLLEQDVSSAKNEIKNFDAISESISDQIATLRGRLSAVYQRSATAQDDERSTIEAQIRGLQEQISSQATTLNSIALERSRTLNGLTKSRCRLEKRTKAVSDTQRELKLLDETKVLRQPTSMPGMLTSHLFSLMFVAFLTSLLVAFGTITLFHSSAIRNKT